MKRSKTRHSLLFLWNPRRPLNSSRPTSNSIFFLHIFVNSAAFPFKPGLSKLGKRDCVYLRPERTTTLYTFLRNARRGSSESTQGRIKKERNAYNGREIFEFFITTGRAAYRRQPQRMPHRGKKLVSEVSPRKALYKFPS